MTENRKYYPFIMFHVSFYDEKMNRDLTSRPYQAMYFMGDPQQYYENFVEGIADSSGLGIQIDVQADANEPNMYKKGANIIFKDTTPRGKFPSHNKTIRINPNEYKAIRFNMGDGKYVCVKCGLYNIAEEHCIPRPGETQEAFKKRSEEEFLPIFCSMKPTVEEYEHKLQFASNLDIDIFEEKNREIVDYLTF